MSIFVIAIVIATCPLIAALIYGTWKFSGDADVNITAPIKVTSDTDRHSNRKRTSNT